MKNRLSESVTERIRILKKEKNAVILAHYYQVPEIQDIADFVGDSLALSQNALETKADIILFAGVHFMAETAKILNPDKKVLIPDLNAGCSLADSCPPEKFRKFKLLYPGYKVISYINCSAQIKTMSDVICTSSNAVKIVESFGRDEKIIFAPDKNLGGYINALTGRNMILWDGSCEVHDVIKAEAVIKLKAENPDAKLIAHPECKAVILELADYIGSTTGLLNYTIRSDAKKFIVATETGILHQMRKASPGKEFLIVPSDETCSCNDCPYMKMNTLENLHAALYNERPELKLSRSVIEKARKPIMRMLQLSALTVAFLLMLAGVYAQDTIQKDGFNKFYYPNGKESSEGTLKNGKPDGYWKAYYENGTIKSEGNRKNFELDSLWKFYNPDGKLLVEISYKSGKKSGIKTTWLDKETMKENFRDDIKEGYTRYYYPDGKIKQEIPFVKGFEQGFGKEYGSDGTIITMTEYKRGFIVDRVRINRKDNYGRKQGRWYTFYEHGNLKSEVTYQDDKKNGYLKEYAENGDLLKIAKYVDDEIQPEAVEIQKLEVQNEYYPDGKLKVSAMFRNGIAEGIKREYNADGNVEKAYLYKNGVIIGEGIVKDDGDRDGPWKDFYPDGSLRAEGNYDHGKQIGEWKFYHSDGKIEQTGKFNRQGKFEGTWKWFFDSGQLLKEENYHNGLKDGLSTEYDEAGKVIEEGEFVNNNEDGPWFELTGDCFIRGTYRDGLRNGMWYNFYLNRNGSVTDSLCFFKGGFVEDNPDGKHSYYWENGKVKDEGNYVNGRKEGEWYKYNFDGTLFMITTYKQGVETRYDGVKIKPPYEKEEE